MKSDIVKQIEELKNSLSIEKSDLEARLSEIDKALNSFANLGVSTKVKTKRGRKPGSVANVAEKAASKRKAPRGKRARNEMSLKEAALRVTANGPLSKEAILDEIAKIGYVFSAKNPVNSLNTVLYNKTLFKNFGGEFGPIKKASAKK